jgi:hypothetical protein
MLNATPRKVFYPIDEACQRLGLSLLDMSVLVSEGKLTLCTAVPGLRVEDGVLEVGPEGRVDRMPTDRRYVRGLVDLRPEDAWYVLRAGSQTIRHLAAAEGCYRTLVSGGDDDHGYTVIREEVGVRHEELVRFTADEAATDDPTLVSKARGRGSQPHYDWDAARLEAFRRIYFEGVPESYGALIRHLQAWFANRGGRVPDESTLKRRLRDIWAMFGPEAQQPAA